MVRTVAAGLILAEVANSLHATEKNGSTSIVNKS